MFRFIQFFVLCAAVYTMPALALGLRAVPGDEIVLCPANAGRGYVDLMLHAVLIHNDDAGPQSVESLQIEILQGDRLVEMRNVDIAAAERASAEFARMQERGMGVFLNLQLLDRRGLHGVFGDQARLGKQRRLSSHETLVAPPQYFAVNAEPDRIRIVATGRGAQDQPVRASLTLRLVRHVSFDYAFPLTGNWLMRALPMLQGHHRWIPSGEFARDWFKIGAEGVTHTGDALEATNNLGYGETVRAAADGVVVDVISDQVQDRAALMRRPDESIEAARARIGNYNMQRYARDFRSAAAGNLVVLRHQQEGRIEYTSYGHLKAGSVAVKKGEAVKRGQQIAEVGDTGDSSAVHLHFQVNAGPDPFYSASLPFEFGDMRSLFVGQDPGLLVGSEDPESGDGKAGGR